MYLFVESQLCSQTLSKTLELSSLTEKRDREPKPRGNMLIWFRVKDNAGIEFIATLNSKNEEKHILF